jgi:hypothetical protein
MEFWKRVPSHATQQKAHLNNVMLFLLDAVACILLSEIVETASIVLSLTVLSGPHRLNYKHIDIFQNITCAMEL